MRLGLLTDIHANREALSAVLADAQGRGIDRFVILGDLVGYGPDPAWCCDRVAQLAADGAVVIRGNHDAAVGQADSTMNPVATQAIAWTRQQLSPDQTRYLAGLPMTHTEADTLFVHASPEAPADWLYLTNDSRARGALANCRQRVVICGHVHVPRLFSLDLTGRVVPQAIQTGNAFPLIRSRRWVAVIGAVGQPRDGVPQAAWAVYDSARAELTFRRTPYDRSVTAAKVRALGLPESLARRLMMGE